MKSRKTRLFRSGSMSNKKRVKLLRQATKYASIVDAVAITLVKAFGSSLREGEWVLTIPAGDESLARPHERLAISDGPNGEMLLKVDMDPDLRAQIEEFNKEVTATGTNPVLPTEPAIVLTDGSNAD